MIPIPGFCVALLWAGLAAFGQELGGPVYRAEARLVLVSFSVTRGREAVLDLTREDVRVFEGRTEQRITVFEAPGARARIPLEAAFLLDVSGTVVGNGLLDARTIQGGFLAGLERDAEISVYSFAKESRRPCGLTREAGVLAAALAEAGRQKHDGTRLYRAIAEVAREMGASSRVARRVLFVVSDGLPDGETVKPEEAAAVANAAGVRVFPMFAGLGRDTGGRSFDPELGLSRETMGRILAGTVAQLNGEYSVGYAAGAAEGRPRARPVSVRLRERGMGRVVGGTRTVVR